MELAADFDRVLRRLNWVQVRSRPASSPLPCPASTCDVQPCFLRACVELDGPAQAYLNREGRAHIHRLLNSGWTLRSSWPRDWSPAIERWLGPRLVLAHAGLCAANTRLISLVSSRVGRHGHLQPDWPHWLDGALRYAQRHREHLLIVPGTTLAPMVEHFARIAGLPSATLRWSADGNLSDWLYDILAARAAAEATTRGGENLPGDPLAAIWISPPLEQHSDELQTLPLQDRLSLALPDTVLALSIRAAGNLERLVTQRLLDPRFPTGSVFVTLPTASSTLRATHRSTRCGPPPKPPKVRVDWLRRGAVGWVACPASPTAGSPLRHCRPAGEVSHPRPLAQSAGASLWLDAPPSVGGRHDRAVWQLCGPLPAHWRQLAAEDDWPYLVHCTRGTLGPFPEESVESFRERVWLQADAVALHPLETLVRICRERRLRSTCGITRSGGPCVSFSAVPLVPLLRRRTFQAHLNRWDWEPYGLLIRRQRLLDAGAASVIYGSQDDFLKLPAEKKPLFQPRQRKPGKSNKAAWTEEREWRVLHDVDLQSVAAEGILVFTRTRTEAQQLAPYAPWPVLWTKPK